MFYTFCKNLNSKVEHKLHINIINTFDQISNKQTYLSLHKTLKGFVQRHHTCTIPANPETSFEIVTIYNDGGNNMSPPSLSLA